MRDMTSIPPKTQSTEMSDLQPVLEDEEIREGCIPGLAMMNSVSMTHSAEPLHTVTDTDTPRSSMATLLAALEPQPAVSTSSFLSSANGRPDAESTPRYSRLSDAFDDADIIAEAISPEEVIPKRSSIIYIKSDENTSCSTHRYSGKAPVVRPLSFKGKEVNPGQMKPRTGSGLRKLSLLQQRDANVDHAKEVHSGGIRPLKLPKKRNADENSPEPNLSPQALVRSATNKVRGLLRKDEVLPSVVVRPPSTSEHVGFAYSFR